MSLFPPTGQMSDDDALLPPTVLVHGPGGQTDAHRHHCMHVALAREGTLAVSLEGALPVHVPGVWIGPNVAHAIDARGVDLLLLFVDPESREGRVLRRHAAPSRLLDDAACLELRARWPTRRGAFRDEPFATAVFAALEVERQAPPSLLHPGVARALAVLREAEDALPVGQLARIAGLSPGRLGHVFAEQIGIPPRRYLLWTRLQRAAGAIAAGRPITEAAHAAGFADAAHLARTMRRMFGTTAAELAKGSQFVQAP